MSTLRFKLGALRQRLTRPALEKLPNVPDLFGGYRDFAADPRLTRKPGGWEYKGKFYPDYLTVGSAGFGIFRTARELLKGNGVDVGAGLWPLPGATPVDIWRGPGAARNIDDIADGSMDYLFSSHCLEHIENWRETLAKWIAKVRPGGTVFLYLPHPECGIWEPGSPFVGDGHKWAPSPPVVKETMEELGCRVTQFDDGPDVMMSFFVCSQRVQ